MHAAVRRRFARLGLASALTLVALVAAASGAAAMTFVDQTGEVGVDFVHTGGGDYPWYPEIMGGGACVLDADRDGYEDLFFVNGAYNTTELNERYDPTNELYLANGDGTFRDATAGSGLDVRGFAAACSVADYDGDSCLDLYVSGYDYGHLFRNRCDATFEDVTAAANAGMIDCDPDEHVHRCFAHSSAWADYDIDGDLDLYVTNYVELNQTDRWWNAPGGYAGQPNAFYRNNGDGTFTEVGEESGLRGAYSWTEGKSLGVAWQDWNLDGWPDVWVANDETPQFLFENNGDGTFTDVAPEYGVNYTRAGMGLAWGDWDNNGCSDLISTVFIGEMDPFVRNHCTHLADESGDGWHGINQTYWQVRWGVGFVDYDLDGWRDILIVSGGVYYDDTQIVGPDQMPMAYHNNFANPEATATFTNDTPNLGPDFLYRSNARGAAFADLDHDGGVEIVQVNNHNQSARILEARHATGNWIEITLRDPTAPLNPFAIGAHLNVSTGDSFQIQQHFPGSSYLSSNSYFLHYGLGDAARVDGVLVTWPDGTRESFGALDANGTYRIERGGGVTNDTLAPATRIEPRGVEGSNGWFSGEAGFEVVADDRGVTWPSGVTERWCEIDGGAAERCEGVMRLDDGVHTVRAWSVDAAGNRSPKVEAVVKVDTRPPVTEIAVDGSLTSNGWYRARPTLLLEASDSASGVDRIEFRDAGGDWVTYEGAYVVPDGDHRYEVRAVDAAGNVEASHFLELPVDATPPTVEPLVNATAGANGWWRSAATVYLPAKDPASGVASLEVRVGGGAPAAYSEPLSFAEEGEHSFEYRAVDVAGNVLDWTSFEVKVDATRPTSVADFEETPGEGGWLRGVTMTLTGEDATSGVGSLRYRVDDDLDSEATGPVTLPDGDVRLEWWARDVAGNDEPARSITYRSDATPPETVSRVAGPAGENGWWRGVVDVTFEPRDATSGLTGTFVLRDGDDAGAAALEPHRVVEEGVTAFRYWSVDAAGNVEAERSLDVGIDTTPPVVAIEFEGVEGVAGWWAHVAPRVNASDATSGVGEVDFRVDGAPWREGDQLPEGLHHITARVRDAAGNAAEEVSAVVRVDSTPPETTLRVASGGSFVGEDALFVAETTRLALDASDVGAGVGSTWYRVDGGEPVAYEGTFVIEGEGAHLLEYWSVDLATREEAPRSTIVHVDASAPVLADVTPAAGSVRASNVEPDVKTPGPAVVASNELVVGANVTDDASGVARVVILMDGIERASFEHGGTVEWRMVIGPLHAGGHRIEVRAVDRVGNSVSLMRDVVIVPFPWGAIAPNTGIMLPG